jgi:hypothetical protein
MKLQGDAPKKGTSNVSTTCALAQRTVTGQGLVAASNRRATTWEMRRWTVYKLISNFTIYI